MYLPVATARRLPIYIDVLLKMKKEGKEYVKSSQISLESNVCSSTVRRDLQLALNTGVRGFGFNVEETIKSLENIIGHIGFEPIAIVGLGKMGAALTGYNRFENQAGKVVCAFDIDPKVIADKSMDVYHIDRLEEVIKQKGIRIILLTTPTSESEEIALRLEKAGISAIINFTGAKLSKLKSSVHVKNININNIVHEMIFAIQNK